jgi:lysophospholipase L1-like esterase
VRIVAIGDSFTEGVGDTLPDGSVRGWADVVAAGLAAASADPVWYANLAVRGRLLEPIATEQLDAALALDPPPDVLTFNGGGNDMLRSGWDAAVIAGLVDRVARRTAEAGVRLVVLSGPDPTERLPRGKVFAERANDLMMIVDELIAAHPHVIYVDNYRDAEMRRAAYWAPDRLHMSPLGHERVAARVLVALGVPTELPAWTGDDPPRPGPIDQVAFAARYLVPWFARRLSGRSSGDRRSAKFPEWTLVGRPARG